MLRQAPLSRSRAAGDWAPRRPPPPRRRTRRGGRFDGPRRAYFFSGTVFPDLHEQDLCHSPPPAGAQIEILDAQGNVTLTLTPGAAGNFTSSAVVAGVPVPYRARLVANGLTRSMSAAQTSGDCNACHTEQGEDGAPGRLVWPREHDPPP